MICFKRSILKLGQVLDLKDRNSWVFRSELTKYEDLRLQICKPSFKLHITDKAVGVKR